MAQMSVNGFDDLTRLFRDLSNADEIAIEAVNKAAPVLESAMRSAIASAANKGYSTGELAASVVTLPARKNEWGVFSVVKPEGTHRGGLSNAKLASLLEYGRHGGYERNGRRVTTQAPCPWRARAVAAAQAQCEAIMRESVESHIGGNS